MKKLLLSLLVCIIAISAKAQIVKGLEYPKAHFGIRAAFTSSTGSVSFEEYDLDIDSKAFVSAGFALDFRISSIPIYLETGLYYINKGYGYEDWGGYHDEDDHEVLMPLLASYHLYLTDNMSIQPFVGPYVGYGFSSERLDYGIRAGLGWNLGRLYVNVGYDFGMESDDYSANTLFCTVGFNFAGSY